MVTVGLKCSNAESESEKRNISFLCKLCKFSNIFVIVCCKEDEEYERYCKLLRLNGLSMISDHRILRSSTTIGRIAIVRQMEPELHMDFDEEVVNELKRFKVNAKQYGQEKGKDQQGKYVCTTELLDLACVEGRRKGGD